MSDPAAAIAEVRRLLDGIDVAMLTTRTADGALTSRPMQLQQLDADGFLWFYAGRNSEAVEQLHRDPQINLAFVHPGKNRYVAITGAAVTVEDAGKRRELWSLPAKIWFKEGPDDPELTLVRARIAHVDYWQGPTSTMGRVLGFASAMLSGDEAALGSRGRIDP